MTGLALLIPIALLLGLTGLAAFFWAMKNGQFDDCLLYTSPSPRDS